MSGGVYGGDEVGALVFDIGSTSIRSGYAGEDMPKYEMPSNIGYLEPDLDAMDTNSDGDKKYFIDTTYVKVPRPSMEITSFLREGTIHDWDIFERVMDYSYEKHIKSDSNLHPVLMSEPAWNSRQNREKLCELMFEKYQNPAFFLAKNACLSAFANGRSTGLVVDSGATQTSAVPIYDGYVLSQAVVKTPLAGDFVSLEIKKFLDDHNIPIVLPYTIQSKEPVAEGEPAKYTLRDNLPNVTRSFTSFMMKDIYQDIAASTLQVSDTPFEQQLTENMPGITYEFPNGFNRDFGSERFEIPEYLFDPLMIKDKPVGQTLLGIGHIVTTSVGMCDIDIRPSLYSSVIVCGGNSLLDGFTERLNRDLSSKTPPSMRLKIVAPSMNSERRFSSWIGGSILASLGSFQQMWISKQEYEESGKISIEKKCP